MAWLSDSLMISGVVLVSMTLQLVLAFGGSLRHRSSCRVLQLLLWLAYMSADAVAIYALGTMAHESTHTRIFGVWAPLLLLHLGGPDTITAYSTVDNELWRRHLLTMLYQVSVAIYVMYLSEMKNYLLVAAIILLFVGGFKYAEKTAALRLASKSQIVKYCQPVYKYMSLEDNSVPCRYAVMGLKKWETKLTQTTELTQAQRAGCLPWRVEWKRPVELTQPARYVQHTSYLPWRVELKQPTIECAGCLPWRQPEQSGNGLTTIQDFWDRRGMEILKAEEDQENYILCLSHALFKMNMRRYADLYINEMGLEETRNFFFRQNLCHLDPSKDVFKVIEIELKFMYDSLFSKSRATAFSKWGTIMRIINILLLGVGGFLIYRGLVPGQEEEEVVDEIQRTVAYIVISVALMVELLQLLRIVASDWTLVWLICSAFQHSLGHSQAKLKHKALRIALGLLANLRRLRERQYWKKSIQQYSLIDTCKSLSPFKWTLAKKLNLTDFVTSSYIKSEPVDDEFKEFIIDKVKNISSSEDSTEKCRDRIRSYNNNCRKDLEWASNPDHEHLILHWHIATAICEMECGRDDGSEVEVEGRNGDRENEEVKKCVRLSRKLSNYCAYLLVSSREVLPVHSDIARMEYIDVHSELLGFLSNSDIQQLKDYKKEEEDWRDSEDSSTLANGARLARKLLKIKIAERWRILSDYWAGVLIYYADFKKPGVHATFLTVGGEFITQLWALLGHMGFGTGSN